MSATHHPGAEDELEPSMPGQTSEPGPRRVSRRHLLGGVAVAATGALAATVGWSLRSRHSTVHSTSAPPPGSRGLGGQRPNVLLIVTDDQPKHTEWATPTVRSWLGDHGIHFTSAYATTPLCSPSRASIFSGRYAHNHGVRDNGHPYNLDQHTTVQRHLKDAGYRTGLFGKYLNSWHLADHPPHFSEWVMLRPGYVDCDYNVNGEVQQIPGYSTTILRDHLLDFLERSASDDTPWFAIFTPYASHEHNIAEPAYADLDVPDWSGRPSIWETDLSDKVAWADYAVPRPGKGRAFRTRQLRTLRSVDDAVRAIRRKLEELGQLDNTLVIYISDNGFSWADHGLVGKAVPYRPVYEVPLYMSWPRGGLNSGRVDDRIVANIDIAPTILEAAGVEPETPQDGMSLLSNARRDHILLECWRWGGGTGIRKTWASYVSRTQHYLEVYDLHTDNTGDEVGTGRVLAREYYDLARDPYQLQNLLCKATPARERELGIPALAKQLAIDRAS